MWLNEEFEFDIIDNELKTEELEQWCKEHDCYLPFTTNSNRWACFSQYYGRTHGLGNIASTSFAYIISSLMTGMGVSASTEMYIREEEIAFDCIDYLNQCRADFDEVCEEVTIAKMLFKFTFEIYSKGLQRYEYKDHVLTFRVGESTLEQFNRVDGDSKQDKLHNLLQHYFSG